MRVHHLNCGSLCPFGGGLFDGEGSWLRPAHLVCHCLLIETDSAGLVLVDTGFGTGDVDRPHPRLSRFMTGLLRPRLRREHTALAQVEALGFSRRDVRHIVLTHLDFDHAGGIEDFPEAKVHVHAAELEAANRRRSWLARRRYRAQQWDASVNWETYSAHGTPWYGFRTVRDLVGVNEDILMVPLVGHTFGHCGVAVRNEFGTWILLAGDAYFHHRELPHARGQAPRCPPALVGYQKFMEVDRDSRLRNQQRLRDLAMTQAGAVRIYCSHDAHELDNARQHQPTANAHAAGMASAAGSVAHLHRDAGDAA
jgi:glyoxylase-like metal-dependent hydrolase (beta-lactamase superfamily II)